MGELFFLTALLAVAGLAAATGTLVARARTRRFSSRSTVEAGVVPAADSSLDVTAWTVDAASETPRRARRRSLLHRHDYDLMIGRTLFH